MASTSSPVVSIGRPAPPHDLAGDPGGVLLLAERAQDLGQAPLVQLVHQLACIGAGGRVHAHVERRVVGVGEAALASVDLHRGDAEVEHHDVGLEALVGELGQGVRVVHAHEARLGGSLRGELVEALAGRRVAVHGHEQARRPDPVGQQARVAPGPEGAVHDGLARGGRGQLDQLTREDGYVRARHVKKDRQAPRSPPRSRRRAASAPRASGPGPTARDGRRRPRPRPPSRSPRARGEEAGG